MMYNVFYALAWVLLACSVASGFIIVFYHGWWKHRTPSAERMSEEDEHEKIDGQRADEHLEAGLAQLQARQVEDEAMAVRRAERRRIKSNFPAPSDEELLGMSQRGCVILQVYCKPSYGYGDQYGTARLHMFSPECMCPPDFFAELQKLLQKGHILRAWTTAISDTPLRAFPEDAFHALTVMRPAWKRAQPTQ